MGTVYEGVDVETGQTAAVKLLSADMAQQADFRDRFKAEIETLRKLNHPNIVRIFGFGEEEEHMFYAMEFVAGSSLEEQIGRGRAFPWREVAQFGIDVARALRHAHDRGVIHRDIKPGNLLLTDDGKVKLSDFGIARLFGSARLTRGGQRAGNGGVHVPRAGRGPAGRSAQRSLQPGRGAVRAVDAAAAVPRPVVAEMLDKQRFEKPAPWASWPPTFPANCSRFMQLLAKDPEQRIPTAGAVAAIGGDGSWVAGGDGDGDGLRGRLRMKPADPRGPSSPGGGGMAPAPASRAVRAGVGGGTGHADEKPTGIEATAALPQSPLPSGG